MNQIPDPPSQLRLYRQTYYQVSGILNLHQRSSLKTVSTTKQSWRTFDLPNQQNLKGTIAVSVWGWWRDKPAGTACGAGCGSLDFTGFDEAAWAKSLQVQCTFPPWFLTCDHFGAGEMCPLSISQKPESVSTGRTAKEGQESNSRALSS